MRRQTASASISRFSARQRSTCTSASLIDMKPAFAGAWQARSSRVRYHGAARAAKRQWDRAETAGPADHNARFQHRNPDRASEQTPKRHTIALKRIASKAQKRLDNAAGFDQRFSTVSREDCSRSGVSANGRTSDAASDRGATWRLYWPISGDVQWCGQRNPGQPHDLQRRRHQHRHDRRRRHRGRQRRVHQRRRHPRYRHDLSAASRSTAAARSSPAAAAPLPPSPSKNTNTFGGGISNAGIVSAADSGFMVNVSPLCRQHRNSRQIVAGQTAISVRPTAFSALPVSAAASTTPARFPQPLTAFELPA